MGCNGLMSLVLYGSFVIIQTERHRDYFLPVAGADQEVHASLRAMNSPRRRLQPPKEF